ncbi:uncharacterized protein LOC124271447 isoform X6 [Haliotis rubra]|uniref:uncharacterized protein LOC124271447 isoform X6 n=1 Tax=Haliotis rubra TaxID=36100 RepID=UPI001EE5E58A|nr:uncharacterized protein LOC124271447 isoform X6 [Haliotis rubra]
MATLETDAVPEPNFKALILKTALNLGTDDLDALKYLFKDLLPPSTMNDAFSMFTTLAERRLIQQGKTSLLTQAFSKIGRNDLLKHLQGTDQEDLARDQKSEFPDGTVCDFRLVLFGIARDLTSDEVKQAKFYFKDIIGKKKLETIRNAFDLLTILEQVMPDNIIDKLKSCLTQIGRNDLLQDLPDYKASAGASRRSVQEGHAAAAPKPDGAAPGSDAKKATTKVLFPGSLGKANPRYRCRNS